MIACACKCGRQCEVPDNMAGSLIECPACGSTRTEATEAPKAPDA